MIDIPTAIWCTVLGLIAGIGCGIHVAAIIDIFTEEKNEERT